MAQELFLTLLPFRKGDTIRHHVGTGKLSLVVSSKTDKIGTQLTLETLSKLKVIRAIQKWYFLKIKYR